MRARHAVRLEHTGNRALDNMQRETERVAERTNGFPMMSGRLLVGLAFVADTPLVVDHGLGRAPRGCIIARNHGAVAAPHPYEPTPQPSDRSRQIALQTSVTTTLDLWIW